MVHYVVTGGLVLLSGEDDVRDQSDSRARFVLIMYDVAIKQFVFAARHVDEERTTPYIYQEATSYICQLQQGLVLLYSILIQLNCVSSCSTALHYITLKLFRVA